MKKVSIFYIKLLRYLFNKKYIRILDGPLKGLLWSSSYNYSFLLGSYVDRVELEIMDKTLKENNGVFIDVGANTGYYSILAKKMNENCKIYSFEPIREHVQQFEKHLQLNKVSGISIIQKAVSNISGEVYFSNVGNSEGNSYKSELGVFKNSEKIVIDCVSIDEFVEEQKLVPSLIKIDVEGAELDVLRGSIKTLTLFSPAILLATHDVHVKGIRNECLAFLDSINYSYEEVGAGTKSMQGLNDYIAYRV